jgi:hypothetical protein
MCCDACVTLQLGRYFSIAQSGMTAHVGLAGAVHRLTDTPAVASLLSAEQLLSGFADSRRSGYTIAQPMVNIFYTTLSFWHHASCRHSQFAFAAT